MCSPLYCSFKEAAWLHIFCAEANCIPESIRGTSVPSIRYMQVHVVCALGQF